MTICDLRRGDHAVVIKVEHEGEERARLRYLNVYTGAKLALLKVSRRKKLFLVEARGARFALSRAVAQGVRVWKI